MRQSEPAAALQRFSDPKITAVGLAAGAKLSTVERDAPSGRLVFVLEGLPSDFGLLIARDEVRVSARSVMIAWETVMGMIAEAQRERRR